MFGIDLHPPLASFPLALLVVIVGMELWFMLYPSSNQATHATLLLYIATLGVILTFITGYQASELANRSFQVPDEAIERHHLYGKLLLFSILPCLGFKVISLKAQFHRETFRMLYLVFLVACLALTLSAGYFGGQLVFRYGAGVQLEDYLPRETSQPH